MKRLPLFDAICLSVSTICGLIVIVFALTGCKFFGAEPSAPSAFERNLFTIETNWVTRVTYKTNAVDVAVPVFVVRTNELNQIVQVTNTVLVKQVDVISLTNLHEVYDWSPKTNQVYVQGAGAVANIVAPGSGGLVVGLLTAGLAAWGKLRSRKKTGDVLVQNIESILEFVDTVPNGTEYTSAIKHIIKKDQDSAGVREKVKVAMEESVDSSDAKSSASDMQKSLTPASAATVKAIV